MSTPSITCFGEVLWDLLPTGSIAGGAPMNVAFHTNQLGIRTSIISKVGNDQLGRDLTQLLENQGVFTDLIRKDLTFSTGTVNVTFQDGESPVYEIVSPVAWDYIHYENNAQDLIKSSDALVFGSLACRTDCNKRTLLRYLPLASLRVFDVNLREPFYSQALIEELLAYADIVKVNHEELALIAEWNGFAGDEQAQLTQFKAKFELELVLLTKGKNGAVCLDSQGYHEHQGFPVKVVDTIGSGDAFLAAFLYKFLTGEDSLASLAFAGAVGAYVATQRGGTPAFNHQEIEQFMKVSSLRRTSNQGTTIGNG